MLGHSIAPKDGVSRKDKNPTIKRILVKLNRKRAS
jgi:hypothetical protein